MLVSVDDLDLGPVDGETIHARMLELGYVVLGEGHFATVYGRDDNPNEAIRVSTTFDGWSAYALSILNDEQFDSAMTPVIYDIAALSDEGYVAVVERLRQPRTKIEEDRQRSASKIARSSHTSGANEEGIQLEELCNLIRCLPGITTIDAREENFLFDRNGRLVFNDPSGRVLDPAIGSRMRPITTLPGPK